MSLTPALGLTLAGNVIAGQADGGLEELKALVNAGKYAEAEGGARVLLARVEVESGTDSVEAAGVRDVLVEALWRGGKAREPETRELAERAVTIKERALGTDHPEVATSLNNLGNVLNATGDYAAARPLHERALAIREKALGPDHPDVATSLNNLAGLFWRAGDFTTARPLHERALEIRERALGPDHPDVATSLSNLAVLLFETGDFAAARPLIDRALVIDEKALGPGHPIVANDLNRLAILLQTTGDYAAAGPLLERALAIRETALGPDHPDVATSLNDLALQFSITGDYAAARPLLERAAKIQEKTLGPYHPFLANTLTNLATVLADTGDYAAARPLFERTLLIWEKTLGPDHPDVGTSLNNLGTLLVMMGDYAAARPMFERTLLIWEKTLGPEHPDVALVLSSLANLLTTMGEYEAARPLQERSLAIREKALGTDHPDVADSLINLAILLTDIGDYAGARPLLERSLAIREKALGPGHPHVATSLNTLANLLVVTGDYSAARPLLERSLAIREEAVGSANPVVAESLNSLSRLRAAQGEVGSALDATLQAEGIARDHLRLTGRSLSERQALRYAAVRGSGLELALTLAARGLDGPSRRRVLDAVVRSRAVVFDEMAARHRAIGSAATPEVARLAGILTRARSRLANLVVRGLGDQTPEVYRKLLDEARDEKEHDERALADASASFAREFSRGKLGIGEVTENLPPGSALVAFILYNSIDLTPKSAAITDAGERAASGDMGARAMKAKDVAGYLAFVLRSGELNPEIVNLGPADEIDRLVTRWREEVSAGPLRADRGLKEAEAACRQAGAALRRKVWDPLDALIEERARVFVVPDGSLNLVNIAALPIDNGGYLIERGPPVHYLSTERDLVPFGEVRRGEGILVLGSPAYDATSLASRQGVPSQAASGAAEVAVAARQSFRGARSTCGDFRSVRFDPLPGTEREARDVSDLWKHRKARSATQLTGSAASEAAFKELGPGRRILHLATHGFFLGGHCVSALDASSAAGRLVSSSEEPPPATGENPLVLSGLALAGANQRDAATADGEDGILTAEEVAAMDLSGVEWAVLSACDTGAGEIKAGEGLFGLRRAFQIAGTQTVIMSLWSVEDEATRGWMRNLYQERLGGASTAEAVRNASRRMIKNLKRTGLPAHPYYWAGFVAVGDWK
jgi:CHAT domain-containing protein/tetratricopeptide (TPR) repeat protein